MTERFFVVILLMVTGFESVEILKSDSDKLGYEEFKLTNGMQVVMIHDAETKIEGAGLGCKIGSLADPAEYQSLANLLVHMLPTRSQKYPKSGYFKKFLEKHEGIYNARAGEEDLEFYFTVTENFEQALDIFANIFIHPLLHKEEMINEIKTIESEFIKGKDHDSETSRMLFKKLSSPGSAYHQNDIYSQKDLSKKKVDDELQKLFKNCLSKNNVWLVAYSKKSFEDVKQMIQSSFVNLDLPSIEIPKHYLNSPFFEKTHLGKVAFFESKEKVLTMKISFVLPNLPDEYLSNYYHFLARHVLQNQKNSFVEYLKEKKLALGWSSNCVSYEKLHDICSYLFDLDEKGVAEYQDILKNLMKTIKSIKDVKKSKLYKEYQDMRKMAFINYLEPQIPMMKIKNVLSNILHYPVEYAVKKPFLAESFNEEQVNKILDGMTLENSITLMPTKSTLENPMEESVYFTKYTVKTLTTEELTKLFTIV